MNWVNVLYIVMMGFFLILCGAILVLLKLRQVRADRASELRALARAQSRAAHRDQYDLYDELGIDAYIDDEVKPPYIINETEDWVKCPSCERTVERVDAHLKTTIEVRSDPYPWSCKPKKVKTKVPR